MAIRKGVATFTFLYDDESYTEEDFENFDMADIIEESRSGDMIGHFSSIEYSDVPADVIPDELLALGNDGTFFGDLDEIEHARLDAEND